MASCDELFAAMYESYDRRHGLLVECLRLMEKMTTPPPEREEDDSTVTTTEETLDDAVPDAQLHPVAIPCVQIHLSIDSADEVDPDLNLVKVCGDSLLREKMNEAAGNSFVIIVDQSKPIPVEVVPFTAEHTLALVRKVFDELPGPSNYVVAKHGMSLGIGTSHGIGSATAYKGTPSNCSIEFLCVTASRPVYMVTEDFIFDPGITTDVFSTIALNNINIVLPSSFGTKGPSIIVDVLGRSHMVAMTVRLCSTLSMNACTNSSEHEFRLLSCGVVLIQAQKMLATEFMNSAATMVYMATKVAALTMRCWRTMYRTSEPFAAHAEQAMLIDLGLNVSGDAVAALHPFIAKPGPDISAGVCKTLLDTYFKHGLHAAVRMVFQEMPLRDSVTYKAMMMESSWEGLHSEALELFVALHHAGLGTSQFTF